MIDQAKQSINAILEELALNNEINPATLIWLQKNHFGYKDSVTIEAERHNPLDDLPPKEDILKRLPPDYDENDC